MINRQQAKDLPFSTLRFLRISAQKTRRRRQIHDMFLMLLADGRAAADRPGPGRPTVTNLHALFGGAATAVAIVLDNSASMGMIDNDKLRFETARAPPSRSSRSSATATRWPCCVTGGKPFPEPGQAGPHPGPGPPDARPGAT